MNSKYQNCIIIINVVINDGTYVVNIFYYISNLWCQYIFNIVFINFISGPDLWCEYMMTASESVNTEEGIAMVR